MAPPPGAASAASSGRAGACGSRRRRSRSTSTSSSRCRRSPGRWRGTMPCRRSSSRVGDAAGLHASTVRTMHMVDACSCGQGTTAHLCPSQRACTRGFLQASNQMARCDMRAVPLPCRWHVELLSVPQRLQPSQGRERGCGRGPQRGVPCQAAAAAAAVAGPAGVWQRRQQRAAADAPRQLADAPWS